VARWRREQPEFDRVLRPQLKLDDLCALTVQVTRDAGAARG
jgi:hypothetical protein